MKNLLMSIDHKVRNKFTFWDLGLLKTYGAIPGLILGACFPEFVLNNLWIWLSIFLILLGRYAYLLFFQK